MTIGGASHRALVRILMHARSTEAHAYVRANYTRGTGSPRRASRERDRQFI
jgi:hypothetical protein